MDSSIQIELNTPLINIELPGGARGLKGDKGDKGDIGATPQITIGTVEDTDEATASITGSAEQPELNLGLPRGKSGVWVGETEPDNPQYNVWIDPTGDVTLNETDPIFTASAAHGIASSDITSWNGKQDALVSGTNIKTINNESLLGSGNINIGGGSGVSTDVQINGTSIVSSGTANILTNTAYNASTNKIATMSDIPSLKETYAINQETQTNKVYVDSNNVEHTIYRKVISIDISQATEVVIDATLYKAIAHNITNYSKAISISAHSSDYYGAEAVLGSYPSINSTYLLFYDDGYGGIYGIDEVTIEYTKSS